MFIILLLLIILIILNIIKSCEFFKKVYQEYHQIDVLETETKNFPNFYNGK